MRRIQDKMPLYNNIPMQRVPLLNQERPRQGHFLKAVQLANSRAEIYRKYDIKTLEVQLSMS